MAPIVSPIIWTRRYLPFRLSIFDLQKFKYLASAAARMHICLAHLRNTLKSRAMVSRRLPALRPES
jgi:hypothetical protein